ncbi:MAG: hypothetical protein ACLQU2_34935 [Candidatus Binataceae bacterium]
MKEFVIAAALLAGCASISAPGSDRGAKLARIAEESQAIAARERECKDGVEKRTNDELAPMRVIADASTDSRIKAANERKQRQLAMCKADAERANDELSAQERAQYEGEEQEQRDRAALVRTLLTSRPH